MPTKINQASTGSTAINLEKAQEGELVRKHDNTRKSTQESNLSYLVKTGPKHLSIQKC